MKEQKRMNRAARIAITIIALVIIAVVCVVIFFGFRAYSGMNTAFEIALNDAGVLAQQAKAVDVDFDFGLRGTVYEVEFYSQRQKYNYVIDSDGTILNASALSEEGSTAQQSKDSSSQSAPHNETLSDITEQHAKQLVLSQANIAEDQIYDYDCEIDSFAAVKVYEIEFGHNGYEYTYYVNTANGAIVHHSKKFDR
ncbi:MAG: PepSY domain-containing protein [Clostridia bacterium]|nr:PepSY domain-containing protein [Clostridia bacterium]